MFIANRIEPIVMDWRGTIVNSLEEVLHLLRCSLPRWHNESRSFAVVSIGFRPANYIVRALTTLANRLSGTGTAQWS